MVAAVAFAVLIGILVVFQLALALGAPWGRLAWGGQHQGSLPVGYRVGSAANILVYGVMALLALDRTGLVAVVPDATSRVGMWAVFGVLVLGTLMNAVSRSKPERFAMTPVALALAILALFVSLS